MKNVVRDKDGECINIGEWDHDIHPVINSNAENMTLGEARAMEEEGKNPDHLYDERGELITEDLHPLPEGATQKLETIIELPDGGSTVEDAHSIRRRYDRGTAEDQIAYAIKHGWDALVAKDAAIKAKYPRRQD